VPPFKDGTSLADVNHQLATGKPSPVCLVYLVCFVYLVDLVHLVSFVQPKNKTDQRNQTDQTD
jgi:hypothetical protein